MNTLFLLMAEYESAHVPLEKIARKYLSLSKPEAYRCANNGTLPFPAVKSVSKKSPWIVDLRDVAEWWDKEREKSIKDHSNIKVTK